LHTLALRVRRRLVVGLALASYLIAAIGFPMPAANKDRSRPYPCQNHSCGCLNAEQCWRSCCCYSAAEKLDWAQSHAVEAPAEVVAEATAGWNAPRVRDQRKPAATEKCCCCAHADRGSRAPAAEEGKKRTWVVGLSARQCRGVANDWMSGATAPPPPAHLAWFFDDTPAGWLAAVSVEALVHVSPPLPPPPRA
jgi:hypothetical protein